METTEPLLAQIEEYEGVFRSLVEGFMTRYPVSRDALNEEAEYEDVEFNQLVNRYLQSSEDMAAVLLSGRNEDADAQDQEMDSPTSVVRRMGALVGGDFLAALVVAGLAADRDRIVAIVQEEFGKSPGLAEPGELLEEAVLVDGLASVVAGLQGLQFFGAANQVLTETELVAVSDEVTADVLAQGASAIRRAARAAIPAPQLGSWGTHLANASDGIRSPLPGVKGWMARKVASLLEAARAKILSVSPPELGQWARDHLATWLVDLGLERAIGTGLIRLYDARGLHTECVVRIRLMSETQRQDAAPKLRAIPGHAKSWLRWGGYGASALGMAAPLFHGTGFGFPVAAAVGSLLVLYTLWIVRDHLGWPQTWSIIPVLSQSMTVLAVL